MSGSNDPGMSVKFPDLGPGPHLREMRPSGVRLGVFIYSFDIEVEGTPRKAEEVAITDIPKAIKALPKEFQPIISAGYKELREAKNRLDKQTADLKRREQEVAEENRKLMAETDEAEKLTRDVLNLKKQLEYDIERGKAERHNWRDRISSLVNLKTEEARGKAYAEVMLANKRTRKVQAELDELKKALSLLGKYQGLVELDAVEAKLKRTPGEEAKYIEEVTRP